MFIGANRKGVPTAFAYLPDHYDQYHIRIFLQWLKKLCPGVNFALVVNDDDTVGMHCLQLLLPITVNMTASAVSHRCSCSRSIYCLVCGVSGLPAKAVLSACWNQCDGASQSCAR